MVHKLVRGLITADLKRHVSFVIQAPNSAVLTRGHTFKLNTTRYRLNIAHNLFFEQSDFYLERSTSVYCQSRIFTEL